MQFRLSHVLALLLLVLTAGVVSVQQLEAHVGKSAVPGIVVVDAPAMDLGVAETLAQRWPGAVVQWVPAEDTPAAPFTGRALQLLRERGWAAVLLAPELGRSGSAPPPEAGSRGAEQQSAARGAELLAELRRAWGVLVAELPAAEAPARLADFVREQQGGRSFIAALVLTGEPPGRLMSALRSIVDATDELPSFRRTSIVVLGARESHATGRRLALRLDRGPWSEHVRPALADLLPGSSGEEPAR